MSTCKTCGQEVPSPSSTQDLVALAEQLTEEEPATYDSDWDHRRTGTTYCIVKRADKEEEDVPLPPVEEWSIGKNKRCR